MNYAYNRDLIWIWRVSSRKKKRRVSTFILEIFVRIFCVASPTGIAREPSATAVRRRRRRTNDLMREGLENPTVATNREMREGKRDTRLPESASGMEKIRPANTPGMNPLMQRNTNDETNARGDLRGTFQDNSACSLFHSLFTFSFSLFFLFSLHRWIITYICLG